MPGQNPIHVTGARVVKWWQQTRESRGGGAADFQRAVGRAPGMGSGKGLGQVREPGARHQDGRPQTERTVRR